MTEKILSAALVSGIHILIQIGLIVRVLLRPHRVAASRIAWIVVILAIPFLGILSYILLGETSIGRKRAARLEKVISQLPDIKRLEGADTVEIHDEIPDRYVHLFEAGKTVNGFDPNTDGDVGTLDSDNDGDLDIFEIFQGTDRNGSGERYGFQEVGATSGVEELSARYRRSTTQDAVEAVGQWSCDMVNWYRSGESVGGVVVTMTETVVDSGAGYEIVEAVSEVTTGSSDCLFYRLELLPIE